MRSRLLPQEEKGRHLQKRRKRKKNQASQRRRSRNRKKTFLKVQRKRKNRSTPRGRQRWESNSISSMDLQMAKSKKCLQGRSSIGFKNRNRGLLFMNKLVYPRQSKTSTSTSAVRTREQRPPSAEVGPQRVAARLLKITKSYDMVDLKMRSLIYNRGYLRSMISSTSLTTTNPLIMTIYLMKNSNI